MRSAIVWALLALAIISSPITAQTQDADATVPAMEGDRVRSSIGVHAAALDDAARAAVRVSDDYVIGAGDVLTIQVRGKVDLGFGSSRSFVDPDRASSSTGIESYEVKPDGTLQLPLIGSTRAAGLTVAGLRAELQKQLSNYYKHFTVDISVSNPGTVRVWISGHVDNPGPLTLPRTATVVEALLRAGIQPNGSTRMVKLTRGGKTRIVDAYEIVSHGNVEANVTIEAGDNIHVPPVTKWVDVFGDVCRAGRYEMVAARSSTGADFCINDLLDLAQGLLPTAQPARAMIERPNPAGEVTVIHVDLSAQENPALMPGDKLIVPSVCDFQPTIRLVGEFKGDGVYQRTAGAVLNKSGVYRLAKGETIGDIITRTGGTTPQADLKRAKIERRKNDGGIEVIPLDLERLITKQDRSADAQVQSGDTVVIPALQDKVYVFGQVQKPGGFAYEPDRRLLDYLASAGGPAARAKSTALLVRGTADKPEVTKLKLSSGMKGDQKENPVVQPGDVIYVPEGLVTDWRDLSQIITTVRLFTLL